MMNPRLWLYRSCIGLLLAAFGSGSLSADAVTSFEILNEGDYVIASDLDNAGADYNRHGLRTQFTIRHDGSPHTTYDYRLILTVRDQNGTQVPILSETGGTGPGDYWITYSATMGPSFMGLPGSAWVIRSPILTPTPGNVLSRNNTYRVRMVIQGRLSGVGSYQTITTYESPLRRYFHFASRNPTDAALNVYSESLSASFDRTYLVDTVPARSSLPIRAQFRLHRYDDYERPANSPSTATVQVRLTVVLRESGTNASIPLETSVFTRNVGIFSFEQNSNPKRPRALNTTHTMTIRPLAQLNPVQRTYRLEVQVDHVETPPSSFRIGDTVNSSFQRILHFNGNLDFGSIRAVMTGLTNDPPVNVVLSNRINTVVGVPAGGLRLADHPTFTSSAGTTTSADLYADGTAVFLGGSVPFSIAGPPPLITSGRSPFEVTDPYLTQSGLFARLLVSLPAGYTLGGSGSIIGIGQVPFPDVPLNSSLQPLAYTGNSTITSGAYLAVDTLRSAIGFNQIQWSTTLHRFTFNATSVSSFDSAYRAVLQQAVVNDGLDPADAIRIGNNFFHRGITAVQPNVRIDVTPQGRGNLTAGFSFTAGAFFPHFPRTDTPIEWTGGQLQWSGGVIDTANSFLTTTGSFSLSHTATCDDEVDCPFGTATSPAFAFLPDDNRLRITPDGGLIGTGELTTPRQLRWGYQGGDSYAHETDPVEVSAFHMAGSFLKLDRNYGSPAAGLHSWDAHAGELLATGWGAADPARVERPGTAAYLEGLADYPGLNFRATEHGPLNAISVLGGEIASFLLRDRAKYVLRPGGITGIHEPAPGTFNAPPRIYGYDFTFSNFGLAFLDNVNVDSVADGGISLPYPSEINIAFEGLTLNCIGELDEADVAEGQPQVTLAYWQADLDLHSIRFVRNPADACSTGVGFLTVGVETQPAAVDRPIAGTLGFRGLAVSSAEAPDGVSRVRGNLLTPADGIEGAASRLPLPESFSLAGPREEKYVLNPVGDLYFNNYDYRETTQEFGFATFPVGIKVPFFREMQVQILADGRNTETSSYYIAGGWPNKGWKESDRHFFKNTDFDGSHWGFPINNVSLELYRTQSSAAADDYRPRALQKWLGIIEFDYPLVYNRLLRSFKSPKPEKNNFVLFEIKHQVRYLSAERAELAFGLEYDGIPQINLANIAFDALDEGFGISKALTSAAQSTVRDALTEGIDRLGDLLEDKFEESLNRILDPLLDEFLNDLYAALETAYANAVAASPNYAALLTNWADLRAQVFEDFLHDGSGDGLLVERLVAMTSPTFAPIGAGLNTVLKEIDEALAAIENALKAIVDKVPADAQGNPVKVDPGGSPVTIIGPDGNPFTPTIDASKEIRGILVKNTAGDREILRNLVRFLLREASDDPVVRNLGEILAGGLGEINKLFNELISDLDSPLDELEKAMKEVNKAIKVIREALRATTGIAQQIEDLLAAGSPEIRALAAQVNADIEFLFTEIDRVRPAHQASMAVSALPSPLEEFPLDVLKQRIRRDIQDRLGGTAVVGELRKGLKRQFYPVDALVKEIVDTVFSKVGDLIKDLLANALRELQSEINDMLGDVGSSVGAGKIEGYAHIHGDALRRLRLDGEFKLSVPSEMEFKAFLLIEQMHSDGPGGCAGTPGETVTEITLGAKDVKAEWLGEMIIDVSSKFTVVSGDTYAYPAGLAGAFALKGGGIDFEAFKIKELSAGIAFGRFENYLTAATRVEFGSYEIAGGIFFGRTCTTEPIRLWDPDVADILGTGPFTGAYVYGEGWIPISETVLGVPATCLFRVSVGVGAGVFFFLEGPTYGGKVFGGVSGEVLCLITIKGEITMVGVKKGDDFSFSGKGKIAGSIGPCPVCLKIEAGFKAKYENDTWEVDL
ncbi:MAG: methyl-accepting chemotaxis protein [Puniceicoccaceae bacterium]|nr:MAG: methyl-accepting chemotaxis protein [Puniceicoccaceae bacterium]